MQCLAGLACWPTERCTHLREGCLAVRAHTAGGGVGQVLSPAGCCVVCSALSLRPLVQLLLKQDPHGNLLLQG